MESLGHKKLRRESLPSPGVARYVCRSACASHANLSHRKPAVRVNVTSSGASPMLRLRSARSRPLLRRRRSRPLLVPLVELLLLLLLLLRAALLHRGRLPHQWMRLLRSGLLLAPAAADGIGGSQAECCDSAATGRYCWLVCCPAGCGSVLRLRSSLLLVDSAAAHCGICRTWLLPLFG